MMPPDGPHCAPAFETEKASAPARGFSMGIITLLGFAGMMDFIDRFVFSTANDAIKHDLHLTDATIGLLGGTAFALLYGVMVMPFAFISDRGYAARMATGGLLLWSLATAFVGRAQGVTMIAVGRIGVGVGQAAFSPSTSSLNAAYATPESRSLAFGICYGISYLGYIIGLAGGGYLVGHLGWRTTFVLVGLAGLPVVIAMWWWMPEPAVTPASGQADSWRGLLANRPLRDLLIFGTLSQLVTYGTALWGVSFYMRSFGLTESQAGGWFGLGIGIPTMLGTLIGAPIAHWITQRRGLRGAMQFLFWTYLLAQPLQVFQFTAHSLNVSLLMLLLTTTLTALGAGALYGAIPTVVPENRRAAAAGLYALLANALGIGLGPPLFGWISDLLTPRFGENALRMSLLVAAGLSFVPAVPLFNLQRRLKTGSTPLA